MMFIYLKMEFLLLRLKFTKKSFCPLKEYEILYIKDFLFEKSDLNTFEIIEFFNTSKVFYINFNSIFLVADQKCFFRFRGCVAIGQANRNAVHSIIGRHVWKRPYGCTLNIFSAIRRNCFF